MRSTRMTVAWVALAWVVGSAAACAATVNLVDQGKPVAVIILGREPTALEEHAAQELARYVEKMTGARLAITRVASGQWPGVSDARSCVLIGRAETNPLIEQLVKDRAIRLSVDDPGLDGYVIQTLGNGQSASWRTTGNGERPAANAPRSTLHAPRILLLGGSNDRGTLYSVYHLLGDICGIGFFWDGERVPRQSDLSFTDLAVRERPLFKMRQEIQGCVFAYTTDTWGPEEWRREMDWAAWHRLNTVMLPGPDYFQGEMGRIALERAHLFGMTSLDAVDHVYQLHPDPERRWDVSPDEMRQAVVDLAQETLEGAVAQNPEAVIHCSGWALTFDPDFWSYETAKAFLEIFPTDKFVIWDLWCDYLPLYNRHDYFHGRDWTFTILHTLGRMNYLHGDVRDIIRRAKAVANDPQADHCVGFFSQPESFHHNIPYFELAMRLAWDPNEVTWESFIQDFCRKRYGEESAPAMVRAWNLLADTAYAVCEGRITPLHVMADLSVAPDCLESLPVLQLYDRFQFVQPIRDALAIALGERERQKGNILYEHDLVDLARQLVFELFDYHAIEMLSAYVRQDHPAFDEHAAACEQIMDGLQRILSADPRYWLATEIDRVIANGLAGQVCELYQGVLGWVPKDFQFSDPPTREQLSLALQNRWKGLGWADYQRTDCYELFVHNYRRRVEAFLSAARAHFDDADRYGWTGELSQAYEAIANPDSGEWAKRAFLMSPEERYQGTITEAVARTFAELSPLADGEILPLQGGGLPRSGRTGWEEDFEDVGKWTVEGQGELRSLGDGTAMARTDKADFTYRVDLSVDLEQYPILAFRIRPIFNHLLPWIIVLWEDTQGQVRRTLVWGYGPQDQEWKDYAVHLGRQLGLAAQPRRLLGLEIASEWDWPVPNCQVRWDWIRLVGE